MNSFATAKLVSLETHKDHEDGSDSSGHPGANLSNDITDKVMRFEIGIRVPRSDRIVISMQGKTNDPNNPLHYSVLAEVWTEEICVCFCTHLSDISRDLGIYNQVY